MTKNKIIDYLKINQEDFSKKYGISKIALFEAYIQENLTYQQDTTKEQKP